MSDNQEIESAPAELELTSQDLDDESPEAVRSSEERPGEDRSFATDPVPVDGKGAAESARLIPEEEATRLHQQWDRIQGRFVDEPRSSVQEADQLAAQAITRLADSFAGERSRMEAQWSRGDDVSTEELRQTLRKYRALFERLLAV